MAPFLSRLLSIQKRFSNNSRTDEIKCESKRVKPPEFDSSKQVRVLLFRELNGQDRRLLFDSKSVRKRDPSASPGGGGGKEKPPLHHVYKRYQESSIEKSFKLNDNQSKDFVYEWQKSSPDEQMLREMIFGSVSISYQGTTFKVHSIRSPLQIMLSVVFPAPPIPMFRIGEQETEESGQWTVPSTTEIPISKTTALDTSDSHLAHSVPVNVPSRLAGHYGEESDSDSLQSHDGYSSLPTQHLTPEPSPILPRSSSYNSLQRRLLRNKATSIEMGLQKPQEDSSLSAEEYTRGSNQKRVKLGLSVVIHLNEEDKNEEKHFSHFLFTHMPLVEGHLLKLKETVVRAYLNRRCFVQLMFEGAKKFQRAIEDLYTAPRLQHPEWLSILSSSNGRQLSYTFLSKFAHLLRLYDKKETHFFVSTLLTAVLTHHLSWVPSVIPTDSKIHPTQTSHKHTPGWVDLLAKSRPYNPHWVQLSDLYGALGSALKLCKTVVHGQKKEVVLKFLQVLSYFIRCSDICEQSFEPNMAEGRSQSSLSRSFSSEVSSDGEKPSIRLPPLQPRMRHCSIPCCSSSPASLPQNVCASRSSQMLDIHNADSASDSSKDSCDVSITPTEERILNSSDESLVINESKIVLETVVVERLHSEWKNSGNSELSRQELSSKSTNSKNSELFSRELSDSCPRLCSHLANSKNSELSCRDPTDSCQGLSNVALHSDCESSRTLQPSPCINVTICGDTTMSSSCRQCCACVTCPCYDKPHDAFNHAKDFRTEVKECESLEEGYHSMEEPHSPGKGAHPSLRHYTSRCPEGLEEVTVAGLHPQREENVPHSSFGWSLMAGVAQHYLQDFCLQGLTSPLQEEHIREDLAHWTQTNVLGEQVSEAVCIVADTDKWTVELLSSNYVGSDSPGGRILMSSSVSEMCDSILNMCELGIPPESCIIYLEDRLQELYFRSQTLSDYLRSNRSALPLSKVSSVLNVDVSDLPLLLSIATTHAPFTIPWQNR